MKGFFSQENHLRSSKSLHLIYLQSSEILRRSHASCIDAHSWNVTRGIFQHHDTMCYASVWSSDNTLWLQFGNDPLMLDGLQLCSVVQPINYSIIQPKEVFRNIPKSGIKTLKSSRLKGVWLQFMRANDRNSNLSEGSGSGANKLCHVLVGFGMRRPSEIFDHYCSWSHIQIIPEKKDINGCFSHIVTNMHVRVLEEYGGNSALHRWSDGACPHDVVQPLISLLNMLIYQKMLVLLNCAYHFDTVHCEVLWSAKIKTHLQSKTDMVEMVTLNKMWNLSCENVNNQYSGDLLCIHRFRTNSSLRN